MFNAFLKIDGVEGEATQDKFQKQIPLLGFNLGANNSIDMMAGGGRGAGRASLSTFNISKATDKASPILFQACCLGKHFPKAEVSICKAGGTQEPFMTYKFDTVFISDINWSGGGDETPAETLSLAYSKIEMTYKSQDEKGQLGKPVVASYDIAAAKG